MNLSNQIIIDELTKAFYPNTPGKAKGIAKPDNWFPINVEINQHSFDVNDIVKIHTVARKFGLDMIVYPGKNQTNEKTYVQVDLYLGKEKMKKIIG